MKVFGFAILMTTLGAIAAFAQTVIQQLLLVNLPG